MRHERVRVKFYQETIDELYERVTSLTNLSSHWEQILIEEKTIPKDVFTKEDMNKIMQFESYFKVLLTKFGYKSKPTDNVKISLDNYMPEIVGDRMRYNIRFDSSASDLIRTIWAYTCSLLKVSDSFSNTNHPRFLAFDEPAQQNMANSDFRSFLKELSSYQNVQTIIFASFNQSDDVFNDTTKDIPFKLHWIKDRLIKPS